MFVKDFDKEILVKIYFVVCFFDCGELKEVINIYFELLMVFKIVMKKYILVFYLCYYGGVCWFVVDWGRVKEYFWEVLELVKEVKDVGFVLSCCGELGNVFRLEGR